MTPARADRLVRRARRRAVDGRRGLRARRALRRLGGAGDRGVVAVVDAVWRGWLADADEALWALLARWHRPAGAGDPARLASLVMLQRPLGPTDQASRRALVDLAARADHPVGHRARIRIVELGDQDLVEDACASAQQAPTGALARFCVERGLRPANPVARALFLVLTGQDDQYQALDADGSLLAAAYRAADPAIQARLRETMVQAGELDRARAVAGADRWEGVAHLSPDAIAYFARQLAERHEWHDLWRLVREAPLARGVGAMTLFAGWIPDDPTERRLFERLSRTPPKTVAAAAVVLRRPEVVELQIPPEARSLWPERQPGWRVTSASFSPDLAELAVTSSRYGGQRSDQSVVEVFDLATGAPLSHWGPFRGRVTAALHLGDAVVATNRHKHVYPTGMPLEVLRLAGERRQVLRRHQDGARSYPDEDLLIRVGAGFAVISVGGHVLRDLGTGGELRWQSLADRGLTEPGLTPVAVEAGSLRLAIGGHRRTTPLTIVDRDLQVVARLEVAPRLEWAAFDGPERVITVSRRYPEPDELAAWRVDDRRLVRVATAPGLQSRHGLPAQYSGPVVLPGPGRIVCVDTTDLVCFDLDTLHVAEPPAGLGGSVTNKVYASPGGELVLSVDDLARYHDTATGRTVDRWRLTVHNLLGLPPDLTERPMRTMTVADLRTVARWEQHVTVRALKDTLGLLRTSLEHRFDTEVGLGEAQVRSDDPYGISLSPPDDGGG